MAAWSITRRDTTRWLSPTSKYRAQRTTRMSTSLKHRSIWESGLKPVSNRNRITEYIGQCRYLGTTPSRSPKTPSKKTRRRKLANRGNKINQVGLKKPKSPGRGICWSWSDKREKNWLRSNSRLLMHLGLPRSSCLKKRRKMRTRREGRAPRRTTKRARRIRKKKWLSRRRRRGLYQNQKTTSWPRLRNSLRILRISRSRISLWMKARAPESALKKSNGNVHLIQFH